MVYQSGKRRLPVISTLFRGSVNDVHICCDEGSKSHSYVTLLVIKDRKTARIVVELETRMAAEREAGKDGQMPYLEAFPWQDQYCLLFEYRSPRPVREFFVEQAALKDGETWEKLALGMVLRCMEESIRSYAFLYLLLKQEQFHMGADGEIYVNYFLDLEGLDAAMEEGQCVCACAGLLADLLEEYRREHPGKHQGKQNPELLEKKAERSAYRSFWELYQDVKLIASPKKQAGIFTRIKAWGYRRRELGFRLLVILSFALAALALVTLVSQLVTGDVGWFRLLFHTFDQIGTETLS